MKQTIAVGYLVALMSVAFVNTAVAQETGKNGSLWAENKCDATCQEKTIEFVTEFLAEDPATTSDEVAE